MVVKTWNHDSLTAHAQFIPVHTLNFNSTINSVAYVPCTNAYSPPLSFAVCLSLSLYLALSVSLSLFLYLSL